MGGLRYLLRYCRQKEEASDRGSQNLYHRFLPNRESSNSAGLGQR